jgi:hypothetical protein
MNNSLRVIITAIGIAVLASPVMAQTGSHSRAQASISNAHGSAASTRTYRPASHEDSRTHDQDCVHTPFPQCSTGD